MPDNVYDIVEHIMEVTKMIRSELNELNSTNKIYNSTNILTIKNINLLNKPLKLKGIKGLYSSIKSEIVNKRVYFLAARIIQRNYRLRKDLLVKKEICPVSLMPVNNPYYTFNANGVNIYYNVEDLANYLITSGKFEDPKTRIKYSDINILSIDNIIKKNKIKLEPVLSYDMMSTKIFTSVYDAKKNIGFYRTKKRIEEEILSYDRILDSICISITKIIETDLHISISLMEELRYFENYYRLLRNKIKKYAHNFLYRTINNFKRLKCKNNDVKLFVLDKLYFHTDIDIEINIEDIENLYP